MKMEVNGDQKPFCYQHIILCSTEQRTSYGFKRNMMVSKL